MALSKVESNSIQGIVSVFPINKEDNLDLPQITTDNKKSLVEHTGIRFRHRIIKKETRVNDLFKKGIQQLLSELNWKKSSVDLILVVTQTSKNTIPGVACELQGDLDFGPHVMAYDINLGCSGFVYGLNSIGQTLNSLIKNNAKAILCCGDISSHLTNSEDMTVRPIFSDAVSVIGIEKNDAAEPWYFNLETFGKGKKAIYTEKSKSGNWMKLNGIDVFNYSLQFVPNNIKTLFQSFNQTISETDLFVLHQANAIINKSIVKTIKIDPMLAPSTLYEYGNTASASIPITLSLEKNLKDKRVLLSGFGVGFSVGSCLIKFENELKTKSIFIDA